MGMLRLWLALAVAIGHTNSIFGFSWRPDLSGGRAVQMFYVISGFLITLILSGKYSADLHGRWVFYTNRALKIFVPYLAVLAGTIILSLVAYVVTGNAAALGAFFAEAHNMSAGTWAYASVSNLFLFGQDWGSFLAYRGGELVWDLHALEQPRSAAMFHINTPAWTLSIELSFYLVAPFLVRRHFLLLALSAFALHAIRYYAYHIGWFSYGTDNRFFPFELGLFLYGALLYRANDLLRADIRLQAPIAFGCLAGGCHARLFSRRLLPVLRPCRTPASDAVWLFQSPQMGQVVRRFFVSDLRGSLSCRGPVGRLHCALVAVLDRH
jgi:peptidoglycan/LPS O-acetylase OafA/YrhL